MMINTAYRSLNFDGRAPDTAPEFLILHYTECGLDEALKILTDASSPHPVSAHYVIDEDGNIYQLVDEGQRAWHAGISQWKEKINLNTWSIGIELIHPGHGESGRPYTQPQMENLLELSHQITKRYKIAPEHVLGHSDIAPDRKKDPGEFFDWKWLARHGIGLWPSEIKEHGSNFVPCVKTMQQRLKRFGYGIPTHGEFDALTQHVIMAFQRHFCPENVSGNIDRLSFARAEAILEQSSRII